MRQWPEPVQGIYMREAGAVATVCGRTIAAADFACSRGVLYSYLLEVVESRGAQTLMRISVNNIPKPEVIQSS